MFKVGDRVCLKSDTSDIGTVIAVGSPAVAVEFDRFKAHRHTCAGRCKPGHGWFVFEDDIDYASEYGVETDDISYTDLFELLGV